MFFYFVLVNTPKACSQNPQRKKKQIKVKILKLKMETFFPLYFQFMVSDIIFKRIFYSFGLNFVQQKPYYK